MAEYNERRKEDSKQNTNYLQVKELYNQGFNQKKIIEETGLSKGYVSKLIKKIKEEK